MDDLISRQQAIDALQKEINKAKPPFDDVVGSIRCGVRLAKNIIEDLPSAQPEESIPVSWIESKIERFMVAGDAFSGLTASIIRVMLNEWKKEQEGDTT